MAEKLKCVACETEFDAWLPEEAHSNRLCRKCNETRWRQWEKEERSIRSEELITELEDIYLSGPWRKMPERVKRVDEIKEELSLILV